MSLRPSYVPKNFAGKCKIFPPTDALLLGYQKRWVMDQSIMKLMEKGRRIGLSYATAYGMVRSHGQSDRRLDSWISSRDDSTAQLVIRDCKNFAQLLNTAAKDLGERVLDEGKGSVHSLAFANRTTINSVSSNPDAFVGKGGDVTIDEFAVRPQPREVYAVSAYTIDWGGALSIVSTHRGSANYFNELITEIVHKGNPKGFSHHKITLQTALDEGLLYKLQSKFRVGDPRLDMDEAEYFNFQRNRSADEESFLQECMCVPGDDASAFLSYDLIAGCKYPAAENWQTDLLDCKNPLYLGVDVGRTNDLTVFWLTEKIGGTHFTRRVITMQKETFSNQEAVLYRLLELPQLRRACFDKTGIGMQFAERAAQRFGSYRCEGVNFSGPVKEDLAYPVRAAFEDRTVRIPDENKITADLRAIRKETTPSGNIRFAADRSASGHADRFWALALALHAGKSVNVTPEVVLI